MSNNGPSRYVLNTDESCGVPMCIYWSTDQLADWISEIGYPQYRVCMERNFITGLHLICLDASTLPDIGIADFEHITDIAGKVRALIGLDHIIKDMNLAMYNPMIAYLEMKRRTGNTTENTHYLAFIHKHRRWYR